MSDRRETGATSVDAAEVRRFGALAARWWDPDGAFRALHRLNPVRLDYIRDHAGAHFGRRLAGGDTLTGLRVVDVGCGGGLLTEPMARLGATVIGLDPAPETVAAAQAHAEGAGLEIDYRAGDAEALAAAGERFDIVLNMEVVEHVADMPAFMAACCALVAPGGLMFVSTINRTAKAFALAIVGAEYLLGWLPRGTHSWEKFLTPDEIGAELAGGGLRLGSRTGVVYSLRDGDWRTASDMDVNYMLVAEKPAAAQASAG